jgi:hypothetical protein
MKSSLLLDPEDAWNLTFVGIASDGDGVRDDVQRYIALSVHDLAQEAASTDRRRGAAVHERHAFRPGLL